MLAALSRLHLLITLLFFLLSFYCIFFFFDHHYYYFFFCHLIPFMPKQISKTCFDCEKTIRKNQKSLTCSQCLQFKHVKCPGRKAQYYLQTKPTTTADWTLASVISHFLLLLVLKLNLMTFLTILTLVMTKLLMPMI